MALAAADQLATFDLTVGQRVDMSEVMTAVLLADTTFLGRIPMGEEAKDTAHYYYEDSLNATTVTQEAAELSAVATTLNITADQGNKLRIGALLKDIASGKSEVVQVTAISTTALTVTRGYGSTDGEVHAASAVWRILSQPVQEGHSSAASRAKDRTERYNRCQIFKAECALTGSMMKPGRYVGAANEWARQVTARTLETKRELGMSVIHGIRSAAGSDSVYRTMGGIREFINNFGGTAGDNWVTTSEAFSDIVLNALYRKIWDAGGSASVVVGHADMMQLFSMVQADRIRLMPSDRTRGVFVNRFLTNLGQELDLLIDRWASVDEVFITDPSKLELNAYRPWFFEMLAKTGDAQTAQLIGEYTLSVRNPTECHAYHTNLS